MKTLYKTKLLAGASAVALGLGVVFAPAASAFNEVNWTWDAHIDETITKNVRIRIDLDPTGMVMLEDLQVSIGDIKAESKVFGVYNYQPTDGNGTTTQSVAVDLGEFTAEGGFPPLSAFQIDGSQSGGDVSLTPTLVSSSSNGFSLLGANFSATWDLGTIMVEFEVPNGSDGPLDALTQLPEVVSAATAVANNASIDADTAVQLHEGQFAFGGGDVDDRNDGLAIVGAALLGVELADAGVNSNLIGAGVLGTLAIFEAIDPAKIEAKSEVGYILNATVDSSATAVANNLTVNVEAAGDDRLFIGDVVQFAYADVEAKSVVHGVSLNNYTNLGSLGRPIVNSIATAVGNNKSITVSAPAVSVAP